jgi:hypothetical protein
MTAAQKTFDDAEDLIQIQLRLEEEMTKKGADAYLRNVNNAKVRQDEPGTAHGMILLKGRVGTLAVAIKT